MAKILGILTAIVLLAAAVLAFKNKEAYQQKIDETLIVKSNLEKNTGRLQTAQAQLKVFDETSAANEVKIAKLNEESETTKSSIAEIKLQIETKNATVTSNTEQIAVARDRIAKIGSFRELADDFRSARTERDELVGKVTERETTVANLTAQNTQAEQQAETVRKRLEAYSTGQSLPSLNTRIQSIYPNWGFVTLAAGNTGGVVSNSVLHVVRSGETIARLLVTAVERGTSSASIIPDSIATDVTLMVGDKVVASTKMDPSITN